MSMRLETPLTHAHFLAVRSRSEVPPPFPLDLLAAEEASPAQNADADNLLELTVAPCYQTDRGPVIVLRRFGGPRTPRWDLAAWRAAGYETEYVADPFSVDRQPPERQVLEG